MVPAVIAGCLSGCGASDASRPQTIPVRHITVDRWPESVGQGATWAELQAAQQEAHERYLAKEQEGYQWFAHSGNGTAGVPFILLRLLPELYPDIFGKPEEHFSPFGYVVDTGDPQRPLPLGLGWQPGADGSVNVVTLTCGACHIGYVRLEDRKVLPLVGSPNTRVDVRKWRHAFELAAQKIQAEGPYKTSIKLNELLAAKPTDYFYGQRTSRGEPAAKGVEEGERQFFSKAAELVLTAFVERTLAGQAAVTKQKQTSYSKPNAPPLDGGSPGQSDGSGDLIPKLLQFDLVHSEYGATPTNAQVASALEDFTKRETFPALPMRKATVTDILSTWCQNEHLLAQIDGTVKSPFYRNIAAILAVVGDPHAVNYENARVCADFLNDLPPPAYPFKVDMRRARRGRALFQQHCALCHKPQNTVVYRARPSNSNAWQPPGIGTDANRAEVLNEDGVALFVRYFRESVPADYSITGADGAQIRPRELPDDSIIVDRSQPDNQGYVTDALHGLWARGPYLHNGSVPTVWHLLVPSSRPKEFLRGSISFDQAYIGWQWDCQHRDEILKSDPQSIVFDTHWDGASNFGHDRDLTVDTQGRIVREGWDEFERDGVWKVRLDWSGPEHQYALDDLLEYLKTL